MLEAGLYAGGETLTIVDVFDGVARVAVEAGTVEATTGGGACEVTVTDETTMLAAVLYAGGEALPGVAVLVVVLVQLDVDVTVVAPCGIPWRSEAEL